MAGLGSESRSVSKETTADPIHYVDWLTLLGFMPDQEALNTVRSQNMAHLTSGAEWVQKIRSAKDVANQVSGRKECKPEVRDIGTNHDGRISKIEAESTFKMHSVGMHSVRFALVELSKLHTFQTRINTEYADWLLERAPEPDDSEGALKFCLPTSDEKEKTAMITAFNPTTNTFSATTDNLDLRILGNANAEDPVNHTPIAGFYYGFGLPLVSVVDYKGTFLIKNGSHRAYALRKKGHDFLPCLLCVTDSFPATGAQVPGSFPLEMILSDQSPILPDFDSGAAVMVPHRRVKVVATIHAEVQVVFI